MVKLTMVRFALRLVGPPTLLAILVPFLGAQSPAPRVLHPLTPIARAETAERRVARLELRIEADSTDLSARLSLVREYADLATSRSDRDEALALAYAARRHGLAARALAPDDTESHYWLATGTGLAADLARGRERIRLAEEAWRESLWVLERDSLHAGAHYLQGRIHSGVMRLNRVTRVLARLMLGGEVLGQASWDLAEYHTRRAAELEDAPMHHFELAMVYREHGPEAAVVGALERAAQAPGDRALDSIYRERARAELAVQR